MTPYKNKEEKFLALFPDIVSSIVAGPQFVNVPDIRARVKELLEYNSSGGNKTRGLMTVHAYQLLEEPDRLTEDSMRLARILGWCVELFQTSLVILDDLADNSSTRRGQQCWYRLPSVGLLAVNDSLLLLTIIFDLLKDHFSQKYCYPDLLFIFKEALSNLCIGQYPSLTHSTHYDQFTIENYRKLSDYKRTYYTFKLPVYASLLLAGKPYKDALNNAEDFIAEMGILISMQNDYMDCFGNEAVAGKAGTDIQEGTCTWLAVTALQRCSAAQRAEFETCYGRADEHCVQRVKRLYEHLDIPAVYHKAEQALYDKIVRRIETLPTDNVIPPSLLLDLFEMVYRMTVD